MTPSATAQTIDCDVLVIGSGAAGIMAALTANAGGLDVVVVEKEPLAGGTTARSGGWLWVPCNPVSRRAGIADDPASARQYISREAGNRFDAARVDAFLSEGPRMVEFCEQQTLVRFTAAPAFPDYHMHQDGAAIGRPICAEPFDARPFGRLAYRLQRPLRAMTFLGMAVSSGSEMGHFFNATRSLRSMAIVLRRLGRYGLDLARYGLNMRLANGNALAGRLLASLEAAGVPLLLDTPVTGLMTTDGRVTGAELGGTSPSRSVRVRRGVVLATGGFQHNAELRSRLMSGPKGDEPSPLAPPGNTGDGWRLGEQVGGTISTDLAQPAAWAPVSHVRWRDGEVGCFAHITDRAKPGVIAVLRDGTRFVDETCPYHDFVVAMRQAADRTNSTTEAFLICDHTTLRRYGLGFAKPSPLPLQGYLKSGYLIAGRTLDELAQRAGIAAQGLRATVDVLNRDALNGKDSQFGRGDDRYGRYMGDSTVTPNPCLGSIQKGPFYAIRVTPGTLTTYAGLRTDARARVLDANDQPITGLYAAGSDMLTIGGGGYLGGGANLGPAMTFGFIAARDLVTMKPEVEDVR